MSYHISHSNERHQDTAPVCANDWSSQFLFIIIMKYIALIGLLLVVNGLLHTSKDFEKNGNKVRDGVFKKVEAVQLDTVCNNIVLTQAPYNYSGIPPFTQMSSRLATSEWETTKGILPSLSSSMAKREPSKISSRTTQH